MARRAKIATAIEALIATHGARAVASALHDVRNRPKRPRGRPAKNTPVPPPDAEPTASIASLVSRYRADAVQEALIGNIDRRNRRSTVGAPDRWHEAAVYAWALVEAQRRVQGPSTIGACRALLHDGPLTIVRDLSGGPDMIVASVERLRKLHRRGGASVAAAPPQQRPRLERIIQWHVARLAR